MSLHCPDGYSELTVAVPSEPGEGSEWVRFTKRYRLEPESGNQHCEVEVVPDGTDSHQVLLSAIMLEEARDKDGASAFESTSASGTVRIGVCEDSDGELFRVSAWKPGNIKLCEFGFSGNCPESRSVVHRYREASFFIDQAAIERDPILGQAGFALGNFNYRVEDIALNFVGTDVRSCENAELPQSCYSGGFVPYSIIHQGPYQVRNYNGELYDVPLFTGNIEHARGLATERYITNPIADADKSLLADYTRHEFQGRPLDGNFVIRVWEDDGFDFDQIQDVQLILNYRYWTRFD